MCICAEILRGEFRVTVNILLRIPLIPNDSTFLFTIKRFPIILSFAMTMNKSQGQMCGTIGVYLQEHIFPHGMLYDALSRFKSKDTVSVLI